jgi:uncharacterized protein
MKIAILGATGFAGGFVLTEALTRPELDVTAIVRTPDAVTPHERLKIVKGDVFDSAALTEALRGHDVVVHSFHPGRAADMAVSMLKALQGTKPSLPRPELLASHALFALAGRRV